LKSSLGNGPSILLDPMRYSNSWRHWQGIIPDPQGVSDMPSSRPCSTSSSTSAIWNRLILELQSRCGLRIGETLKIKFSDAVDRRLILKEPKSGKESEMAFMPEQIAKRLHDYIQHESLSPEDRIFPICYSTARALIKNLGGRLNVVLTPHGLRRYSATYASRNGVPLEIVSKVILRHQDLKTTQAYLGRVTESEAIRWMDVLHGR